MMTRNKGLQSKVLTVVLNTQKSDKRMSKRFFKILFYLIVFAATAGYSQTIPWTVQETSIVKDITININQSLYEGDTLLLGAFYSSSPGFPKCGGFAKIPGDSVLIVYGKDAYNDGFLNGEQYEFRVYNPKKGCYMELVSYNSYTFGSPAYLDDSSLSVVLAQVVYPQTVSCRSKEDLSPIINDNLITRFSSTPYGLAIDSITGTINTENSRPGVYKINAITESCLMNDSFPITITEEKKIFQTQDTVVCDKGAQIGTYLSAKSYSWNTGDSLPHIYVTKSGVYILEMEDTNGCLSDDTISVNIFNLKQSILGNDTTVCLSSYTLTAPEGYTYEWNTKSTDRSIVINNSGKYTVIAKDKYCSILDTIDITLKEPVQFDLGKDTISGLCTLPYHLQGPSGYNYYWNTGETTEEINVTKSGMYTLDLSDDYGCKSRDNIYLDFSWANIPQVNLGPDTIVCGSPSFTINAGKSGFEYLWNTGESGGSIEVTFSGLYSVNVKDQNGCSNSDTIAVGFKSGFLAGNISVEIDNPPCSENISVALVPDSLSGTSPYTYDLIRDGFVMSNSANGVFYNVKEGTYNFEIRDSKGCKAFKTNDIIIVKKAGPCLSNVLAFTGTSQPSYYIEFPGTTKIYDMSGILIKTIPTPAEWDGTGNNGEIVPMGDYIIVSDENQRIIVTVIK